MRRYRWISGLLLVLVPACNTGSESEVSSITGDSAEDNSVDAVEPTDVASSPAPDFTLLTPSGTEMSLSDFEGQVVLVNFWASWCPPCKAEMPALETYYQEHKDEGFVVLAVNYNEDVETVKGFIEEEALTFPVVIDREGKVLAAYGVTGLPSSYIVGRQGQELGYWPGSLTLGLLDRNLTPLLAETE
ncbi:MAG: TlpA family protein disulfide reductase [Anaerolineae bacterium]